MEPAAHVEMDALHRYLFRVARKRYWFTVSHLDYRFRFGCVLR